jgi:hypothetical protein
MRKNWLELQIGWAFSILIIFFIVSCGSSSQKKTLTIKTLPSPSIVIESDFVRTYTDSAGKIVKDSRPGPWTLWSCEATNLSTSTITIFALHYEFNARGAKFKGDVTGGDTFLVSASKDYLFSLNPGEGTFQQVVITGLPTRDQIGNLSYFFFGRAIGWYGDPSLPQKSYKTTFSFRASE